MIAQTDVPRGIHGPLHLDHVTGGRRQWRGPRGAGATRSQAAQVTAIQPGGQRLNPVAVQEHMNPVQPSPQPDGAPSQRRAEPDPLPGDPQVSRRRDHPVQFHGPAFWPVAVSVLRWVGNPQVVRHGIGIRDGRR